MPAGPRTEAELLEAARRLEGTTVEALSAALGMTVGARGLHSKGKVGELLERALGAEGGPRPTWDFPGLRVELKTVPVDERGRPRESTFVCALNLLEADRMEWESSWVRAKLRRLLWVPCDVSGAADVRIGRAQLWSPTTDQERVLRDDFDEIVGRIGMGGIEGLSARVGRWLQLRPKAAHGGIRTFAPGSEEGLLATVPRGFYLRARFTRAILTDPEALPT